MSSKKESRIESESVAALCKMSGFAIKIDTRVGYPDRLITWTNKHNVPLFFNIEFKTKTGRLSPVQKHVISRIPGNTYICRSVDEAIAAFNKEKELFDNVTSRSVISRAKNSR